MSSALEQAKKAIPAEVHMISGCRDEQTSADVSNVAVSFLSAVDGEQISPCTAADSMPIILSVFIS